MPRWLYRAFDFLTQTALVAAAGACALCTLAPWGTATLFQHLTVEVPGAVYRDGTYVAAAGAAALIRRSRIVGVAAGLICLWYAQQALGDVPVAIKKAIVSAQMTLFPLNNVLDQAHLRNLTVGDYSLENSAYLDFGLHWTTLAAQCLLAVSIFGDCFRPTRSRGVAAVWGVAVPAMPEMDFRPAQSRLLPPVRVMAPARSGAAALPRLPFTDRGA